MKERDPTVGIADESGKILPNFVLPAMWGRFLYLDWVVLFFGLIGSPHSGAPLTALLDYWGGILSLFLLLDLVVAPLVLFRWRTRAPRMIEVRKDRILVYLGLAKPIKREIGYEQFLGVKTPPSRRLSLGSVHFLAPSDWSSLRALRHDPVPEFEAISVELYVTPQNARTIQKARTIWRKSHPSTLRSDADTRIQALIAMGRSGSLSTERDGWVPSRRRNRTISMVVVGVTVFLAALVSVLGYIVAGEYTLSGSGLIEAVLVPGLIAAALISLLFYISIRGWVAAARIVDSGVIFRTRGGREIAMEWKDIHRLMPGDRPDWLLTYSDKEGPEMRAVSAEVARAIVSAPSCPPRVYAPRKRAETGDTDEIEDMFGSEIAAEVR